MKLRINKLISDAGLGSRRDAEKYITDGRVKINGRVARLTDLVGEKDIVLLDDIDIPVKDLIHEEISLRKHDDRLEATAANKRKQEEKRSGSKPKQYKESSSMRGPGKPRPEGKKRMRWDDDDFDDFDYSSNSIRKGNRRSDNPVKKFRH